MKVSSFGLFGSSVTHDDIDEIEKEREKRLKIVPIASTRNEKTSDNKHQRLIHNEALEYLQKVLLFERDKKKNSSKSFQRANFIKSRDKKWAANKLYKLVDLLEERDEEFEEFFYRVG